MVIGAISGSVASGAAGRRSARGVVEAASAASAGRDRTDGGAPGRALVPAGPSPSAGPRAGLRQSAPFIAQVAAAHLGSLPDAERRVQRRPEAVAGRAGAAYGRTVRLATELETGFLVSRAF